MLDSVAGLLTYQAANYFATGDNPPRMGNAHASIVPYGTFDVRDGQLMLAIGNDDQWRRFCDAADLPELARDARFATNPQRVTNRDVLLPLLMPVLRTRDRAGWTTRLRDAGVPCGAVRAIGEMLADPQLEARGMIASLTHPTAGQLRLLGNPVKLSDMERRQDRPAPTLGQHTDAILREVGIADAQLADLHQRQVV
jgi:crotonobetainyl-CoA:carnitine CoA-transferase CaiB-like acyl-CoA transferase